MGKYFLEAETYRVDFPDGEWVDIKEELTQEDQDYILNQMAKAETSGKDTQVELTIGKMALLERSIIAWSFLHNEKPVAINHDNISTLRQKYRAKVLFEANRLNEAATEFTRKN